MIKPGLGIDFGGVIVKLRKLSGADSTVEKSCPRWATFVSNWDDVVELIRQSLTEDSPGDQ